MSDVIHVTNAAELENALHSATGGERIELAAGDYGDLYFANRSFSSDVTITSEDSSAMASIRSLALVGASNLHFDRIFFDYTPDENTVIHSSAVRVDRSANITISNSIVEGGPSIVGISPDSEPGEQGAEGILGLPNGQGIRVVSSDNVRLENNDVSEFYRGIILNLSDNVDIVGNEVHHTRASTLAGGGNNEVLVEGNHFHSAQPWKFGAAGDHGDYVFFWTGGKQTEPSDSIIIRDNLIDQGDGEPMLGIILGDRSAADVGFTNAEISGNIVNNGHNVSISVDIADGVTIRENTLLQSSGGPKEAPKILIYSTLQNATIENNVTHGILERGPISNSVQLQDNLIIQNTDPEAENFAASLFVNSEISGEGLADFMAIPGSLADGIGAKLSQFDQSPNSLTPVFQVYSDVSSGQGLVFDASLTAGPTGFISESDAEFQWVFGDGSTATGQVVKHEFNELGHHDVTLIVVQEDGTTAEAKFTAGIAGNDILQFDAQNGTFEALAYGEETSLDSSEELRLEENAEGYVIKLGEESQTGVAASELSRLFGTESFELSMSLKAASEASWGEIARIHTNFTASVDQKGNFKLEFFTENNARVSIVSDSISLNDGNLHDVNVRYDGKAGLAEMIIDGEVAGKANISGALTGSESSLVFGNPWGKQTFDGELSSFGLSAGSQAFPIYDGEAVPVSSTETSTALPDATPEEEPGVDGGETVTSEPKEAEDTTTSPESDPALTEPVEEPAEKEDSSLPEPLLNGGYQLDFASVATSDTVQLRDDTHIVETDDGLAISFDGKKDFVSLGRLKEFEESQKMAFSVDFTSDTSDDRGDRLVWNHSKLGLAVEGDGIRVLAANKDDAFHKGFQIKDLGLNDGNQHNATVMVDAETDRLQVVVDNVLVFDERDTDFDFVGAGGYEMGWLLGTPWNNWFGGLVHDLRISDDFDFIDQPVTDEAALLG